MSATQKQSKLCGNGNKLSLIECALLLLTLLKNNLGVEELDRAQKILSGLALRTSIIEAIQDNEKLCRRPLAEIEVKPVDAGEIESRLAGTLKHIIDSITQQLNKYRELSELYKDITRQLLEELIKPIVYCRPSKELKQLLQNPVIEDAEQFKQLNSLLTSLLEAGLVKLVIMPRLPDRTNIMSSNIDVQELFAMLREALEMKHTEFSDEEITQLKEILKFIEHSLNRLYPDRHKAQNVTRQTNKPKPTNMPGGGEQPEAKQQPTATATLKRLYIALEEGSTLAIYGAQPYFLIYEQEPKQRRRIRSVQGLPDSLKNMLRNLLGAHGFNVREDTLDCIVKSLYSTDEKKLRKGVSIYELLKECSIAEHRG